MVKEKISILYDVSIILSGITNKVDRAGIYFCAYNVLKYLSKNKRFDILCYVSDGYTNLAGNMKNDPLLTQFDLLGPIGLIPRNLIRQYRQKIRETNVGFKEIIYILKIIKNYIKIFFQTLQFKEN
jgi:hypothetical protein